MTDKIVEERNEKDVAALEACLAMMNRWDRKDMSPEEVKKSVQGIHALLKAKVGAEAPIQPSELFALILNPKNFSEKERVLIQALFERAREVRRKINGENPLKTKGKKKEKILQKNYI